MPSATLAPGAPLPASPTVGPPIITTPAAPPAVVVPAAPAAPQVVAPGAVVPLGATVVQYGREHLRITPDRILAPVGSEVVLKAGICDGEGYLLANQRVEWSLARDGAGQFVDLGERGEVDLLRWPWDTPRKIDNWYAIGSTAYAPLCLSRGNADPTDDVQIARGDAWVTITSATEGTSQVTAYTPNVDDWQLRRATATIYWVDAQWVFPASATIDAGRPHVLTTTVSRRTDGAPLAGWIVRYDVSGGQASLGYEGGNFLETTTDASGRASMEVSPTDVGGGTTNVNVTIIRPAIVGPAASPRLEIGRGLTCIHWTRGGSVSIPTTSIPTASAPITLPPPPATIGAPLAVPSQAVPTPATSAPSPVSPYGVTPQPTLPSTTSPSDRYVAPRDEPPAGKPKLQIRLDRTTPEQVAVGDFISYNVVITNSGEGTARNVAFRDRFDQGLAHPSAKPGEYAVDFKGIGDIAPGKSVSLPQPLTLQVIAGGQQCHEATVSADGTESVSQRACITVRQSAVDVTLTGPRSRVVGEMAEFNIVVKNVGEVAATNVVVVLRCDSALNPTQTEKTHQRLADGAIMFRIERLEPSEKRAFSMMAQSMSQSNNACSKVVVTADGGVNRAAEACVEILPLLPGQAGPAAASQSGLRLSFVALNNPAHAGEPTVIYAYVENGGQKTEQQVGLRVFFPPQLVPDQTQIKPQGEATVVGQEVSFQPVNDFAPLQRREYTVPVRVTGQGTVQIRGAVSATGLAPPIVVDSRPIEILPATN